jgi:ABC-type maltose transport system permease subunit
MLQGQDTRTVALSFYNFVGEYSSDLATIFAAALIALAPIVILYFVLQRQFVEGMASGGLKG